MATRRQHLEHANTRTNRYHQLRSNIPHPHYTPITGTASIAVPQITYTAAERLIIHRIPPIRAHTGPADPGVLPIAMTEIDATGFTLEYPVPAGPFVQASIPADDPSIQNYTGGTLRAGIIPV